MCDQARRRHRPDLHAETVARGQRHFFSSALGLHLSIRGRLEDGPIDHRDVPARQIASRHRQFAGGEQPAFAFLGRGNRGGPSANRRYRTGSFGPSGALSMSLTVVIANRPEDTFRQELEQRHPARLLHDQAGDDVVGVAVLPAAARLEVERLARPLVQDRLRVVTGFSIGGIT